MTRGGNLLGRIAGYCAVGGRAGRGALPSISKRAHRDLVGHIAGMYFRYRATGSARARIWRWSLKGYRRLAAMRDGWQEVHANESLHRTAARLLKSHPLRTGDALQLDAALLASNFEAHSARFLTEDARRKQAAEREGFVVD